MSATDPLPWNAEALWLQLLPLLPGLSVEVLARTESTNTELMERARRAGPTDQPEPLARRQGDAQPCLLVAEHQTGGRGRQGKAWQSSAGASLTFSLALPLAPADWSGLSLAVGLAIAEALDPATPDQPPRLGLKWPNDLLLLDGSAGLGRKLGGILIETVQVGAQRLAVVGVGLNVRPLPAPTAAGSHPSNSAAKPASTSPSAGTAGASPTLTWGYACLQELAPGLDAPAALARVALPLVQALLAFERAGFAPLRPSFARRDVLAGRAVCTTLATLPRGVADGVDDSGTLWLRVDGRRQPVGSGEVSLRPDTGGSAAADRDAAC